MVAPIGARGQGLGCRQTRLQTSDGTNAVGIRFHCHLQLGQRPAGEDPRQLRIRRRPQQPDSERNSAGGHGPVHQVLPDASASAPSQSPRSAGGGTGSRAPPFPSSVQGHAPSPLRWRTLRPRSVASAAQASGFTVPSHCTSEGRSGPNAAMRSASSTPRPSTAKGRGPRRKTRKCFGVLEADPQPGPGESPQLTQLGLQQRRTDPARRPRRTRPGPPPSTRAACCSASRARASSPAGRGRGARPDRGRPPRSRAAAPGEAPTHWGVARAQGRAVAPGLRPPEHRGWPGGDHPLEAQGLASTHTPPTSRTASPRRRARPSPPCPCRRSAPHPSATSPRAPATQAIFRRDGPWGRAAGPDTAGPGTRKIPTPRRAEGRARKAASVAQRGRQASPRLPA